MIKNKKIIGIILISIFIINNLLPIISYAQTNQTIVFTDENLYNAMVEKLDDKIESKNDTNKEIIISNENIETVTVLDIGNLEISNLEGLQYFTNLTELSAYNNNISDISQVANLTNLTNLSINNNNVEDISSVSELINLEWLMANSNQIEDINALENLINLKYLQMHGNNIENIDVLSNLVNLSTIYMASNKIKNIDSLENLSNLNSVAISKNQIENMDVLENKNISTLSVYEQTIYLETNLIEDITLPSIFINSQDLSSICYNGEELEFINCSLAEDNKTVIVDEGQITAQVILKDSGDDAGVNLSQFNITVIDDISPEIEVKISTNEMTKENVTVILKSNEEIQEIEGWELSTNKYKLTKEYTQNAEEEIYVYDSEGNETIVNIKIENIDKEIADYEVIYSETGKTNQDVTVTINAEEQLQQIEGWNISENKMEVSKTYTINTTEEITISDLVGNEEKIEIVVDNIDKIAPILSLEQDITEPTNTSVNIKIISNEVIEEIEGWTISEDGYSLSKKYDENNNETISVYDLAGNKTIIEVYINNIDKVLEDYEVSYSELGRTNQDVTVTINAEEELKQIEGWDISEDKMVLTKTYSINATEEITISDLVGNEEKIEIVVNNIDKIAPTLTLEQDITEPTNTSVNIKIISNELIQEIEGWTLSSDGYSLTKEYFSNESETIVVYDLTGNKTSININIDNIDTDIAILEIKKSTTLITNDDVTVTIISDEELQEISGWILSDDKMEVSKTYTLNSSEMVVVKDKLGNSITTYIEVTNIDKEIPVVELSYSTQEITNENIKVVIESNEMLQAIDGWTLSNNSLEIYKIYNENTEENIIVLDLAGNEIEIEISIDNIDKEKPEIETQASTTLKTNENVIFTIVSNEELQEIEGFILSEDKLILTKEYSENSTETITVYDLAGNSVEVEIEIENIDKIAPNLEIEYKTNEDENIVTVIITSDERIYADDNWKQNDDVFEIYKEYSQSTIEEIEVYDLAGNISIQKVEVEIIEEQQEDETTYEGSLPDTGIYTLIISLILVSILTTVLYFKNKNLRDIK